MTTQKIIIHTPSFLQLVELNHDIFVKVLLLLCTLPFSSAQLGTFLLPPPPPPSEQFSLAQKFNPSMAIIMVVLVSAFFFMGFFSVYVRQCARRRFHGPNFDPAAIAGVEGGGRRSRRQPGLDAAVIETFPTFLYTTVKGLKLGEGSLECAVCLNEFEDDETLRLIPKCNHVFHPDCIDAWLASHTTCPVCRANLVPEPGDLPLAAIHMFESDNNPVEPEHRSNVNDETQNHLVVRIADDNDQIREVPQTRCPDVNLLNPNNQNRPPRSWSTGWRFSRLFPRSHSTGHSLVQPIENCERFTLRLPEEVRSQLMNTHLNRTKSCVAFSRVRSSRRGYRSRSERIERYFYYERFDREEQPNRWGFTKAPPFISRTGSVQSSKEVATGSDEMTATLANVLWSVKPIINNNDNNDNNIGEGSSNWLRHDNQV